MDFGGFSVLLRENEIRISGWSHKNRTKVAQIISDRRRYTLERVYKMAYIKEKKRNGKVSSYVFTTCLERDAQGKQVRKYLTWKPPENLTPAKARKAAERAAAEWEADVRGSCQQKIEQRSQEQSIQTVLSERCNHFFKSGCICFYKYLCIAFLNSSIASVSPSSTA